MTWDHPMVSDSLELIVSQEFGNCSVALSAHPKTLAECHFILEPAATEPEWYADEFFPSTSVRVLFEAGGADLTQQIDWFKLKELLHPVTPKAADMIKKIPPERVRKVMSDALKIAEKKVENLKMDAFYRMNERIEFEISRLRAIQKKNKMVNDSEIEWWENRRRFLTHSFSEAQVRLDSFMLIFSDAIDKKMTH